jgi:hypothetical protein
MLGSYFHVLTLKNNWIREGYQSSQSQLWQSVHAASKDRTVTVSCTSEPPWDWISWKLSGGTAQVLHACWAVRTAVAISLTMSTSTKYVPGVEWKTQERGSMLSKDRFSRTGFEDSPCPSFCRDLWFFRAELRSQEVTDFALGNYCITTIIAGFLESH